MAIYFSRLVDQVLLDWYRASERKPLVLAGARQTGKSTSVRALRTGAPLYLELNLERPADLSLVAACRSAGELLAALRVRHDVDVFPADTLLFIDEIQESSAAVAWLRFLHEDHPGLAVVAAGSLLDVRLSKGGFSFPVGRVTFRTLRPFTFFEFLGATGGRVLADELRGAFRAGEQPAAPLHEEANRRLGDYMLVGGMPGAVARWVETSSATDVRRVHSDLVQSFAEDIHKYKGSADVDDLRAAFDNSRHHYGLRFKYQGFAPERGSAAMKSALSKLEAAHLIQRVSPTSSLRPPFRTRPRSAAKLQPLDVGIAMYEMGVPSLAPFVGAFEGALDGRAVEIFAVQQLLPALDQGGVAPMFWVRDNPRSNAEVDLLLTVRTDPVPIEIKAGSSGSLKSMHQYLWRAGAELGLRLHSGKFADEVHRVRMPDGELSYRLISFPLYAAELVPEFLCALP